jgi:hypothetical protein
MIPYLAIYKSVVSSGSYIPIYSAYYKISIMDISDTFFIRAVLLRVFFPQYDEFIVLVVSLTLNGHEY